MNPTPRARGRIPLGAAWLALALSTGTAARADGPIAIQGDTRIALPPPRTPRVAVARFTLGGTLGNAPYAHVDVVHGLPGAVNTAPLLLGNGLLAVGVASPASIVWIDAEHATVRTVGMLDERPTRDLAEGPAQRVFVETDTHHFLVVAPDGTVRGSTQLGATMVVGSPVARTDGSTQVLVNLAMGNSTEFMQFGVDGQLVETRTTPRRISAVALAPDGCLWAIMEATLGCIDANGNERDFTVGQGATRFAVVAANTIAVQVGTRLEMHAHDGSLRGSIEVGTMVQSIQPLPGGRLAVIRSGAAPTSYEVLILGDDATELLRVPLPGSNRLLGILGDATGAMLAVFRDGTLHAMAPDGSPRWEMLVHDGDANLTQSPVPLANGGVALVRSTGDVVLVH